MRLWIDAQLSPDLAPWITRELGVDAVAVRDLGLRDAKDPEIFQRARASNAIVVTKDSDFVEALERLGPPPKVVWITCGNTSNQRLQGILQRQLPKAMQLFDGGESLVEISAPR